MQLAILGKKNKNNINGEAFNIGPKNSQNRTVIELVKSVKKNWDIVKWKIKTNKKDKRESKLLKLNSNKSKNILSWEPILNFQDSVKLTTIWYRSFYSKINPFQISKKQILEYKKLNKYFQKKKIKRIFNESCNFSRWVRKDYLNILKQFQNQWFLINGKPILKE